ncbi:hypothetical protein OF829_04570 [Sphingomonas sp. LB-2]|uniref:hypothetical protein n=1 Tax=Sphingomonas caeni TaxID=2984949 RepID=UPI002230DDA2|nr:hypothetical protein [Sphingomonas caeni]MCW3846501.1 hypothetical protein [Sphingomonas caeni]
MRRQAPPPAPVVRLTIDRVVVRGAAPVSRASLSAAIEAAVSAKVAGSPGLWSGARDGSATATLRERAGAGSGAAIADALAVAVTRGLGRGS